MCGKASVVLVKGGGGWLVIFPLAGWLQQRLAEDLYCSGVACLSLIRHPEPREATKPVQEAYLATEVCT